MDPYKPGKPSKVRAAIGREVAARLTATAAAQKIAVPDIDFYTVENFLPPATCAALVRMIDSYRRPSTLLSDAGGPGFRTSESCDMNRWSPEIQPIDESIAALLGIPPANGETMQGQRYAVGQQFRAHHDYFHEKQSYWQAMKKDGGQRTWTAMIYLNDVKEGGATWFPQAGIRMAPKRGLLLAWNNMKPDGAPNLLTYHEGMPVVRGTKYIVTKWFREAPWIV